MELIELRDRIFQSFTGEKADLDRILEIIERDDSVFPFNEYEHLISHLVNVGGLTFDQYIEIRDEYISENPNLWIFEISAPRGFGESFAQTYIHAKCQDLIKPSKKLHAEYVGEYDMWFEGLRIEVKASRAVDSDSDEPLYMKALSRNTDRNFLMNFQQLKPQCCDVFLWLAVFRDEIVIWVMSSADVLNSPFFSKGQHRGNSGNEGQLHVRHDNIKHLEKFELKDKDLGAAIREASKRK